MAPRPRTVRGDERLTPLTARIDELELRIRVLEARLREATALLEEKGKRARERQESKPRKRVRARPRCPGCVLELPVGHRGESCVWCGFYLPAVKERARR